MKGFLMRSKIVGLLLGCSLLAATAAPSLACAFHDQASADTQSQQTAQAQPSSPSQTSTQ